MQIILSIMNNNIQKKSKRAKSQCMTMYKNNSGFSTKSKVSINKKGIMFNLKVSAF